MARLPPLGLLSLDRWWDHSLGRNYFDLLLRWELLVRTKWLKSHTMGKCTREIQVVIPVI
jgi:hypothetical protein